MNVDSRGDPHTYAIILYVHINEMTVEGNICSACSDEFSNDCREGKKEGLSVYTSNSLF